MDALDEMHPLTTDNDDEGNVEADEREGNQDFVKRQESSEKALEDENNEDTYRSNQYPPNEIEEQMQRLKISQEDGNEENYDSRQFDQANQPPPSHQNYMQPPYQDNYDSNMNPMQTPSRRLNESYLNYEEQYSQAPPQNLEESPQENSQNNVLIMQYESVLQSVNREFQKLLDKNKLTEEELSMTKLKNEQIQAALEQESGKFNFSSL